MRLLIYATAGRTKARPPALRATYSTPTSRRSLMSPSSIPEQTSPATSRSSGPGWCQEDRRPLSSGHVAAVVSGRPSACAIGQLGSRSRAAVPVRLYGRRQLRKLSELASGPVRDRLELESCPLRSSLLPSKATRESAMFAVHGVQMGLVWCLARRSALPKDGGDCNAGMNVIFERDKLQFASWYTLERARSGKCKYRWQLVPAFPCDQGGGCPARRGSHRGAVRRLEQAGAPAISGA